MPRSTVSGRRMIPPLEPPATKTLTVHLLDWGAELRIAVDAEIVDRFYDRERQAVVLLVATPADAPPPRMRRTSRRPTQAA